MRVNLHRLPFVNKTAIPWIIWSIAGLFYFFEIILRMLPGTMTTHLEKVFSINATQLGIFTASYYWSYTLMQIPAGLIIDRFSIRKTLILACILCVSGLGLVHETNNLHIAELGRFIIGFGSAFAYISALKIASVWLSNNHFGLATCIIDSLGMIGAIVTEVALVHMNMNSGYQSSVHLLIICGLVVAGLIYLILRDAPAEVTRNGAAKEIDLHDKSDVKQKLRLICKNPQIWLIGLMGCLFYLPSSVIGDVWGLPYLKTVYHLSMHQASYMMTTFFLGWIIVGPFLGNLSDRIQRRCIPIQISLITLFVLFSMIIFAPHFHYLFSVPTLFVMFFIIGVAMGTHPLAFALAKENYSNRIAGTVVAFTNMIIMMGGILFQPMVGWLLDLSHHSLHSTSIQHYTASNFTIALSLIPISMILCMLIMMFVKETGHKLAQQEFDQF